MNKMQKNQGALALSTFLGIALIVSVLATALALVSFFEGLIGFSQLRSQDAYLAAQAGVYDALLRLVRNKDYSTSYSLSTDKGNATISFSRVGSDIPAQHVKISSVGDSQGRKRKLEVLVYIEDLTGEARIISWKEVSI